MSKRGFLATVIILALMIVMPIAISADRGSATGSPTPTAVTGTPTTVGDLPNAQVPEGDPDPQAMEELRADLLSLATSLNELVARLDTAAELEDMKGPSGPKVDQRLIQELTHAELYIISESFRNYGVFKQNVETLESLLLAPEKEFTKGQKGDEKLDSFTIIPTPTPAGPGISHAGVDLSAGTGPSINVQAGDIWIKNGPSGATNPRPSYPDVITCKIPGFGNRYPNPATLAAQLALEAAKIVQIALNATCETLIVVCPAPGGTTLPGCTAKKIGDVIVLAAETINNTINGLCVPAVDSAEIQASFENTQILHADLDDHDKYLAARANQIDNFLFDFRDLNLRLNIEASLASPEDDPNLMFTLPHSICVSDDLRKLPEFSPQRVAGCGLLEVVRDTVRSTIDMNVAAGQSVHNAEAEYQAAVEHFNNGEWKLAYARFRKAYREAVRP